MGRRGFSELMQSAAIWLVAVPGTVLFVAGFSGCRSATPSKPSTGSLVPFSKTVWVDPDGRPYDVPQVIGDRFTQPISQPVGRLRIDGSPIMVGDGSVLAIASQFAPTPDEFVEVPFGDNVNEVLVSLLTDAAKRETNGLRLDVVAASSVTRWEPFESAYGTDGGMGAVTTKHVLQRNLGKPSNYEPMDHFEQVIQLADNDELPGYDSLTFANGYGDGGFPMSRGSIEWRTCESEGSSPC
jgi:hypothetical protein